MSILIIKSHLLNPPRKWTRRLVPRVGMDKAAREIDKQRMDSFAVGERGILDAGLKEKVAWSRLTALQLRRLQVLEVRFQGENTLALLKELSRAQDLESFKAQHPDVTLVDLSCQEGELEYIHHPLARPDLIRGLINKNGQNKSIIREGFERLRRTGEIELSELSSWALINIGPELEEPADLKYVLNNISNSSAKIEIFKKLKARGKIKLPELDDETLVRVFPEIGQGDHPYLAERMKEALGKLDGETIGWEYIQALKKLGKDKEPEVQALTEKFRKDSNARIRRQIQEDLARQAGSEIPPGSRVVSKL